MVLLRLCELLLLGFWLHRALYQLLLLLALLLLVGLLQQLCPWWRLVGFWWGLGVVCGEGRLPWVACR